eukprot:TRINITY_DN11533_c0_g1_i1.p1 TRINITY_DN11533_c0_g1~~TRINITY_DN11533_c0_g1_i1.p1  ORF type:complete len:224 (+),score=42.77 TRINITY_DN11533_c0_g1_i1:130-801(+)
MESGLVRVIPNLRLCLSIILLSWTAGTHAAQSVEVTCGSVIKLLHEKTKHRLHSHEVQYGTGSGQQSVTGFPGQDDGNSYWLVQSGVGEVACKQGEAFKNGAIVRLQHQRTHKWLHSHLHPSPLSNNLEVSCFGGDGNSDTGDNWKLDIDGKGKVWLKDQKVRLQHVDTGGFLYSHDKKFGRPIAGQQEVCAVQGKASDSKSLWSASEGVYYASVKDGETADH